MRLRIVLALAVLAGGANSQSTGYDRYGGWQQLAGTQTGFFHTQQIDGRWWLVTPDGHAFFSKGVDNVSYEPESKSSPKPPADVQAWATSAVRQLRGECGARQVQGAKIAQYCSTAATVRGAATILGAGA